ncbi:hypothetical protein PanWU01x14_101720, partial [Parasponia andersonii]
MTEPCPTLTPNYQSRCEKLDSGELKLNVNAACILDGGYTRIGRIIRDDRGSVREAFSRKLLGCYDPLVAELLAIRTRFCGNEAAHSLAKDVISCNSDRSGVRRLRLILPWPRKLYVNA